MENLLSKPGEMDFDATNLAVAWKKWKQTMLLFMEAVMRSKTEVEKYSTFLYIIGQKGRDIFNTWGCDLNTLTVNTLFERFEEYCLPKRNLLMERRRFFRRNQQDESIDTYVTVLRNLSYSCEFGTLQDELILYKVVDGVRSTDTAKKLLRKGPGLTLERALDICRVEESTCDHIMNHQMESVRRGPSRSISYEGLNRRDHQMEHQGINVRRFPNRSISFEGLDRYSHSDSEEERDVGGCFNKGRRSSRCSNVSKGNTSNVMSNGECSDAGIDSVCCTRSNGGPTRDTERVDGATYGSPLFKNERVSYNYRPNTSNYNKQQLPHPCDRKTLRKVDQDYNIAHAHAPHDKEEERDITVRPKTPVVTYSDYTQEFYPHEASDEDGNTTHAQTEIMFVLKINEKLVRVQMGTVAELDVMPKRVFDQVADDDVTLDEIPTEYVPEGDIVVYGSTEMFCTYKNRSVTVTFYVMETDTITMLTLNTCHELGMV